MPSVSRRRFVAGAAAALAAGWSSLADTPYASAAAYDRALGVGAARAVRVAGTTLEQAAAGTGKGPYVRLKAGPGWPLVVRTELARGNAGRDDRRTGLAAFVQFTDLHLVDTQSPVRFEYLAPFNDSAHRPQEALTAHGAASLVDRVNSLARGPFTGAPFDLVMATGDTTDNHELVELDWYLSVMSGGSVTPDTGDPTTYEGVQNSGATGYWHPESALRDDYKKAGFPRLPGFLGAARRQFTAPGLRTPWYTTVGNHDDCVGGFLPDLSLLRSLYTGGRKIEGLDAATAADLNDALLPDPTSSVVKVSELLTRGGPVREITPDARRAPFTPKQFAAAHLNPAYTGAGPYGHGFTQAAADSGTLHYTFPVAPGVLGVSLDTTNQAGWANGSIGAAQVRWLESVLQDCSTRWYDADGTLVRRGSQDQYVLVFSHHTSTTMGNTLPDPYHPLEARRTGPELVTLLQRYPNVLAWINGHTHRNRITPHGHHVAERSFWEINTASHVDFPQHARVIELADNGDGTLSLFTTLIESAAPYATDFGDLSQRGLAALYRELSYNDPRGNVAGRLGASRDHNTELLLARPGA